MGIRQSPPITCDASIETFALRQPFGISRGVKTHATVVRVTLTCRATGAVGHGEGVPYPRYGETPEATVAAVRAAWAAIADTPPAAARARLTGSSGTMDNATGAPITGGAARNALDCALWDLEAKQTGVPVWQRAGLAHPPEPRATFITVSLDTPDRQAAAARVLTATAAIKLKLGGDGDDIARMQAVRTACPNATLLVDPNESWSADALEVHLAAAAELGVAVVEQPLPAGADGPLAAVNRPVPVAADEAVHTRADLARLRDRYDVINIKLDKTGGLTEALAMTEAARAAGFQVMVGSMVSTSLSMAPALIVGQEAAWLDLDSPALLAEDRTPAMAIVDGAIMPADPRLWG